MKLNQVKSKKTKAPSKVNLEEVKLDPPLVEPKAKKATKEKKTTDSSTPKIKKTNLEGKLSGLALKEKKAVAKPKIKAISAETKKVLKEIANHLKEKKCEDIVILNLEEVNSYLSVFVICTVASHTQGRAVARDLERKLKSYKLGSGNLEKKNLSTESGWTLLDLGEIIVHIMTAETRGFYDLDKLWGDAKQIKL